MSDAPDRVWIDPGFIDSPKTALACNFGTASKERALPTDTEYIRADIHAAALASARDDALEKAALLVEWSERDPRMNRIAAAIRAMKGRKL